MDETTGAIGSSAFSPLDRHFAAFVERRAGGARPALALAAALVSLRRGEGHSCLDLEAMAGTLFPNPPVEGEKPVRLPGLKSWLRDLENASVVGNAEAAAPLVLDSHHRLYLHRYW